MTRRHISRGIMSGLFWLTVLLPHVQAASAEVGDHTLQEMPAGYQLQAFDDCGVLGLQPHVQGTQVHVFSAGEVSAGEKARSVAWDHKEIKVVYEALSPQLDYVVAVTYASEPFNSRVQSLWADSIQLHGPRPLPKGKAERLLFRIPRPATQSGKPTLRFKLEGPVNVVVSAIELWAAALSPQVLHLIATGAPTVISRGGF